MFKCFMPGVLFFNLPNAPKMKERIQPSIGAGLKQLLPIFSGIILQIFFFFLSSNSELSTATTMHLNSLRKP